MGLPAARLTDMHVCPMVTGIVPHVGGPILPPCAVTVLTVGLPQARIGDMCTCVGPPDVIAMGAFTVLVSGMPASRITDMTVHGGAIIMGAPTVLIGDNGAGGGTGPLTPGMPLTMEQIETLKARAEALKLLDQAITDLENWDDDTKARAEKWFGGSDDAVRDKMLERAKKSRQKLASFTPDNFKPAEAGEEDCFGYVYPNDDRKMYIGDDFKTAPLTGTDSKAGTMIHETSHYDSVGGTRDKKNDDGKTAYGQERAQRLAQESAARAQENADSWEYFVENQ